MTHLPRRKKRRVPATVFAATLVALTVVLVSGCGSNSGGGQLATPTFGQLHIPDPSAASGWTSYSTNSPPPEVLPTRGRGVRLYFYAPGGSNFSVSLRALNGTSTPLTENQGSPAPPEAGYFQILNVDANQNPAIYLMYVRAPLALADPANFDILVVNRSLRNDMTDSAPLVVSLRQRKVFTVTVRVQGNGHVSSTPSGIRCGNVNSPVCSYEFGPGQVRLAAQSDDQNTRFLGWSGNCAPNVQVCEFTLDGMAAVVATAHFGATNVPEPAANCTAAPLLPGLRWIGQPGCSDPAYNHGTLQCDATEYYCLGPGNVRFSADCRHLGIEAMLRQPGGCYEVASFP